MKRCLYCYGALEETAADFHPPCSRKIFGQAIPPELPYSEADLEPLARQVIQSQTALTGVQPKLSLHISGGGKGPSNKRFTIVGLWGGYILKPPSPHYPELPEVEDLTMHLAALAKIKTAPRLFYTGKRRKSKRPTSCAHSPPCNWKRSSSRTFFPKWEKPAPNGWPKSTAVSSAMP